MTQCVKQMFNSKCNISETTTAPKIERGERQQEGLEEIAINNLKY